MFLLNILFVQIIRLIVMSTLTFFQLLIFDKAKIHIFAESLDVSCYFNLLLSILDVHYFHLFRDG